jgi:hypothetical protein
MIDIITNPVAATVLGLVLAAIGWLGNKLIARNKYLGFLSRLGAYARLAVVSTHETYVKEIKAGRADGVLTEEEKAEALARAKAVLLSFASLEGLGGAVTNRIEEIAVPAIETALAESKRAVPPQ